MAYIRIYDLEATFFRPFAENQDAVFVQVDILECERAEFGNAHAGSKKQFDDSDIPKNDFSLAVVFSDCALPVHAGKKLFHGMQRDGFRQGDRFTELYVNPVERCNINDVPVFQKGEKSFDRSDFPLDGFGFVGLVQGSDVGFQCGRCNVGKFLKAHMRRKLRQVNPVCLDGFGIQTFLKLAKIQILMDAGL